MTYEDFEAFKAFRKDDLEAYRAWKNGWDNRGMVRIVEMQNENLQLENKILQDKLNECLEALAHNKQIIFGPVG